MVSRSYMLSFVVFTLVGVSSDVWGKTHIDLYPPAQSPFLYFNLFQDSSQSGCHTYYLPQKVEHETTKWAWTDIRRIEDEVRRLPQFYVPPVRQTWDPWRATPSARKQAARFNDFGRYYPGLR